MTSINEVKESLNKLIEGKEGDDLKDVIDDIYLITTQTIILCYNCRICSNYKEENYKLASKNGYNSALVEVLADTLNKDYKNVYEYLKETEELHFKPCNENCAKNYEVINELRSTLESIMLEQNVDIKKKDELKKDSSIYN